MLGFAGDMPALHPQPQLRNIIQMPRTACSEDEQLAEPVRATRFRRTAGLRLWCARLLSLCKPLAICLHFSLDVPLCPRQHSARFCVFTSICSCWRRQCLSTGSAFAGGLQLAYSVVALLVFQGLLQSFWTLVAWQVGSIDPVTHCSYVCSSANEHGP